MAVDAVRMPVDTVSGLRRAPHSLIFDTDHVGAGGGSRRCLGVTAWAHFVLSR